MSNKNKVMAIEYLGWGVKEKNKNIGMDWISIKDRLPKKNVWVLVTDGDIPMIAIYKGKGLWFDDSGYNDIWETDDFSHWMSLPEPPVTTK